MLSLSLVFRRKEGIFVSILEHMRLGRLREDHIDEITKMNRPLNFEDGVEPTEL